MKRALLALALLLALLGALAVARIAYSQPKIETRVRGIVGRMKGGAFHVYFNGEWLTVVPAKEGVFFPVSPGDYVDVEGFYVLTYTILPDPVTGQPITRASIIHAERVRVLYRAIDVKVDRGYGATYKLGDKVRVIITLKGLNTSVPVVLTLRKPDGKEYLLVKDVLGPGTYTLEGTAGKPVGTRTLTLMAYLPLKEYYEERYEPVICRCSFKVEGYPDLVIHHVDLLGELKECSKVRVAVAVRNDGEGTAKSVRVVALVGDEVVGEGVIPEVRPGYIEGTEFEVSIPCCPKSSDFKVIVDYGNSIEELNEENNEYVIKGRLKVKVPAKIVAKVGEVKAYVNEEGEVTLTVSNAGGVKAWDVVVRISPAPGLKVTPTEVKVGELPPGASREVKLRVLAEKPGTYDLPLTISYVDECGTSGEVKAAAKVSVMKRRLTITVSVMPSETTAKTPVTVSGRAPPKAAGLELEVVVRREGGEWVKVGTVRVGADGTFTFAYTPEKAGAYEIGVRYGGDEKWTEALAYAKLTVRRIPVSLRLRGPSRWYVGRSFTIVGVLDPARTAPAIIRLVAPDGSVTELEAEVRDGKLEVSVRLNQTGDWRVEALVPGDETYGDAQASLIIAIVAVRPPPKPEVVTAAIAAGTAVGVATQLSPVRRVVSSVARRFKEALQRVGIKPPKWLEELSNIYLEEVFKSVTEKEPPPPEKWRLITPPELKALLASIAIMGLVFGYIESGGDVLTAESLYRFLLPAVAASSLIVIVDELSEAIASKVRGLWAEYSFWPHGAISMIITGLLLNSPFASPGRTLFSRGYPRVEKARIMVHKFLALLALAGVFAVLSRAGLEVLSDVGVLATLTLLFYSLFPVPPLPGHELASVSKVWWAVIFAVSGALYVAFLMKLVGLSVIAALGLLAAIALAFDVLMLKIVGASPVTVLIREKRAGSRR